MCAGELAKDYHAILFLPVKEGNKTSMFNNLEEKKTFERTHLGKYFFESCNLNSTFFLLRKDIGWCKLSYFCKSAYSNEAF